MESGLTKLYLCLEPRTILFIIDLLINYPLIIINTQKENVLLLFKYEKQAAIHIMHSEVKYNKKLEVSSLDCVLNLREKNLEYSMIHRRFYRVYNVAINKPEFKTKISHRTESSSWPTHLLP